jgi:hypothetical protein
VTILSTHIFGLARLRAGYVKDPGVADACNCTASWGKFEACCAQSAY